MDDTKTIPNYVGGEWKQPEADSYLDVVNPATDEAIGSVPLTPAGDVDVALQEAADAFSSWRRVPVTDRVQYLFTFKNLLEENLDKLARTITQECGKTYKESVGELRRGIENVETACGMPSLIQGVNNEDIARGIDEHMIRQPLGVVAAITPFNFPGMIPLWFLPYAIACGNCFILKPSERVPLTALQIFELLDEVDLPDGVVQLLNGSKETVDSLLDHPVVRGVSFVGSTPVAKYVYSRAAENGMRAQCQGGAKNTVVVLPDADLERTTEMVADSAFGCAGQRCLANSLAITVGEARSTFVDSISEVAADLNVGYGLQDDVDMGPVINDKSQERIEKSIATAEEEGARVLVDGRGKKVEEYSGGYWSFPTLLDRVPPDGEIANTEIFGPVLGLMHAETVDDAIELINRRSYGNMACLFTSSGASARKFRYEVDAGNVGINIGVAAPMAFFPFSGWKESFFGDLHAQGRHAVEFYTQTKVVVERWLKEWNRTF